MPGLCGWRTHPICPLFASLCLGYLDFPVEQSREALLARYVRVVHLPALRVHASNVGCDQHLSRADVDYHVPHGYAYRQAGVIYASVRCQDHEVMSTKCNPHRFFGVTPVANIENLGILFVFV